MLHSSLNGYINSITHIHCQIGLTLYLVPNCKQAMFNIFIRLPIPVRVYINYIKYYMSDILTSLQLSANFKKQFGLTARKF